MTLNEAKRIVGHQPTYALRDMVTALDSFPWTLTVEDKERRDAALVVLASRRSL